MKGHFKAKPQCAYVQNSNFYPINHQKQSACDRGGLGWGLGLGPSLGLWETGEFCREMQ